MIEIQREIFVEDEVFKMVYLFLKENHKVAEHTKKVLLDNKNIKDFCEESRHFIMVEGPFYIHYDISSWFKEPYGVSVRIDTIAFYDNFMEYEKARITQLHKAEKKDIPNIN